MNKMLEIKGLEKSFKEFKLGPIDLSLEPGTILGLIGPNGSGKTTTLHSVIGLLRRSAGTILVNGLETSEKDAEWKRNIGFVSDNPAFYENWSGNRNLEFLSGFYPNWSDELTSKLAERFDLNLEQKAKDLSRGNRVKLALIAAMAHKPPLFLFDEPTSGLDPVVRSEVMDVLYELMENGDHAILYSTHVLSDLERLADKLYFLKNGQKLQISNKDDLIDSWGKITFNFDGAVKPSFEIYSNKRDGKEHQLITADRERTLGALEEVKIFAPTVSRLSIEEIAVNILKGKSDVEAG